MGKFSDEFTTSAKVIRISLMSHIYNRIRKLEKATSGVVCLQFADHPDGLSMVVRIYLPAADKEHVFPDVVMPFEMVERDQECERVNVLFDMIEKALNSVQTVSSTNNGLIHTL